MITVKIYSGPRYMCKDVSTVEEARKIRDEYKAERDQESLKNPGLWSRWNCVCVMTRRPFSSTVTVASRTEKLRYENCGFYAVWVGDR